MLSQTFKAEFFEWSPRNLWMKMSTIGQYTCSIVLEMAYTSGLTALLITKRSFPSTCRTVLLSTHKIYSLESYINHLQLELITLLRHLLLYLNPQYLKKKRSLIIQCLAQLLTIKKIIVKIRIRKIYAIKPNKTRTSKEPLWFCHLQLLQMCTVLLR